MKLEEHPTVRQIRSRPAAAPTGDIGGIKEVVGVVIACD